MYYKFTELYGAQYLSYMTTIVVVVVSMFVVYLTAGPGLDAEIGVLLLAKVANKNDEIASLRGPCEWWDLDRTPNPKTT